MGGEISLEMCRLECLDAAGRAQDRPPGGLVGKRGCLHQVEHHVLRRVLRRGNLLEDNVALAGKLGAVEAWGEDDVAQDVQREAKILA